MKKVFAVTTLAMAAISSSAMAQDSFFAGVEYGKAKHALTAETLPGTAFAESESSSEKMNQYGVRFGKYLNDNIRVYASINQGKKSDDGLKVTTRQLTASADYLFDLGPVKPFVGATLGTNWMQTKVSGVSDSDFALAYGAQAGVLAQLGQFDVEAGYRYLRHKNDNNIMNVFKMKNKDSKTPYISVSYRF